MSHSEDEILFAYNLGYTHSIIDNCEKFIQWDDLSEMDRAMILLSGIRKNQEAVLNECRNEAGSLRKRLDVEFAGVHTAINKIYWLCTAVGALVIAHGFHFF